LLSNFKIESDRFITKPAAAGPEASAVFQSLKGTSCLDAEKLREEVFIAIQTPFQDPGLEEN
jgi:hypothetical protein